MPSAIEIRDTIRTSNPDDWIVTEPEFSLYDSPEYGHARTAVYGNDVQLRIEQGKTAVESFSEEWSDRYPDHQNNVSHSFWIVYGRSPIEEQVIVLVDGGRAWIPVPQRPESDGDPWTISEYKHSIGAAVNKDYRTYQDKLDQGGIEVR